MLYCEFTAGGKEYKLRLTTRNIVALERQLGCNPLMIFGIEGDKIPTISDMVAVLHASLQALEHGISLEKAYDIFDAYLEDGHTSVDFIKVIMEVYQVSGIINKELEEEENEKN